MPTARDLIGTWRVTGFQEWSDGQEHRPLGQTPIGYAVFDEGGRIFIQLSRSPSESASPKETSGTFIAYFGTYKVDGDTLTVAIETANGAHDVASTQTRSITLNGDALTIGIPGRFTATLRREKTAPANPLAGAWRVQSFTRFDKDGGRNEPLGSPPAGFAVFDATGRAFVQLGKAPAAGPKEEVAKSLMAYFGPCSIAGDTLSVVVESSNMPAYIGSTQTRAFSRDGDTLKLGTPGEYQAVCKRAR